MVSWTNIRVSCMTCSFDDWPAVYVVNFDYKLDATVYCVRCAEITGHIPGPTSGVIPDRAWDE